MTATETNLSPSDEYYKNEDSLRHFGVCETNRKIRAELIARQHELAKLMPNVRFEREIPIA